MDIYKKYCCGGLNFSTFTDTRKQIFKLIKDKQTKIDVKLLFFEWFFNKIYVSYKMKNNHKEKLIPYLYDCIDKTTSVLHKTSYVRYRDTDVLQKLTEYYYKNRFDEGHFFYNQIENDRYLIHGITDIPLQEIKDHFLNWINLERDYIKKSNLLDVLLTYFSYDERVQEIYNRLRFVGAKNKSVYSDTQNVHDSSINRTAKDAAGKLVMWFKGLDIQIENIELEIQKRLQKICSDKLLCSRVFNRLIIDESSFDYEFNKQKFTFNLRDIFLALSEYIFISKDNRSELINILNDEFIHMKDMCSSGYMTRMINTLQGFDEKYTIKISFESQLYSVVSILLQKALENADENVVSGTFDSQFTDYYLKFVVKNINTDLNSLRKEYGADDIDENILAVLKKITGKPFTFDEDKNITYLFQKTE